MLAHLLAHLLLIFHHHGCLIHHHHHHRHRLNLRCVIPGFPFIPAP